MKIRIVTALVLAAVSLTSARAENFEWIHRNFRLNYWVETGSIKRDGTRGTVTLQTEGVCESPLVAGDFTKSWKRVVTTYEFDCESRTARALTTRYVAADGTVVKDDTAIDKPRPISNGGLAAAATRACNQPVQSPVIDLRPADLMPFSTNCVLVGRSVESNRWVAVWYADTTRITKDPSHTYIWTRTAYEQTKSFQSKDFVTIDQKLAVRCPQQEFAVVEEFLFDANNRQVHTQRVSVRFQSARPSTPQAAVIDLACESRKDQAKARSHTPVPLLPEAPEKAGVEKSPVREQLKSTGTGFFVNGMDLVSNAHVIAGCRAIVVKFGDVTRLGKVTAKDESLDTAVIRIDSSMGALPISLSSARSEELGQDILVLGYPLTGLLSQSVKVTNGVVSALSGAGDDKRMMQISAAVQPGNSGGPVLDGQGRAIGVVRAKLRKDLGGENVNFAVRGAALRSFLDLNDIAYASSLNVGNKFSTAEIAKIGEKGTALVLCY